MTGAVLAGGRSARMGRPKHELRLPDGRTMLEAVAAALAEVTRQVVIVGGSESALPRIADLRADQGPLGGIEALLASGLDAHYLVCPCDVPLVTPPLLVRLTVPATAAATVFHVEGEPEPRPLPARIAAAALTDVRRLLDRGERAVHGLMRALEPEAVTLSRADAAQLANVNTPEDYRNLSA